MPTDIYKLLNIEVISRLLKTIFILLFFITTASLAKSPLLIYYGDNASTEYLNSFKAVVLDPDIYHSVFNIATETYAYISLGEVRKSRNFFQFVKEMSVLKGENPNWKGSYYISLKSGKWQEFVINYLIPLILSKGYKGLFLDTVDSLLKTNKNKPFTINFINNIRLRFPGIKIIMNRGFDIARYVKVDGILFESTITTFNFKKKKYFFLKQRHIFKIPKKIKKYSIDYWTPTDFKTIKKIYNIALKRGYIPYVGEITLRQLPKIRYDIDKKKFIENF